MNYQELIMLTFTVVMGLGAGCATLAYLQGGGTSKVTTINQMETTCIHCRRMRKFTLKGPYR